MNRSSASCCSGVMSLFTNAITLMPSCQNCDTLSTPWRTSSVEPNSASDTATVTMAAIVSVTLRRRLVRVSRAT